MATPTMFNDMAQELHLATYEQLSLCSNAPIRCEERFPGGCYTYQLHGQTTNLDRRSRDASQRVLQLNRFVRISVRGDMIYHPRLHVPIVTDDDVRIARYETSQPECVVASIHIRAPGAAAGIGQLGQSSTCLVPLQMLRTFLSRLSALRAASPPRDLLADVTRVEGGFHPPGVRYDLVLNVHHLPDRAFQETCVGPILAAVNELRGDNVRVGTNTADPVIHMQALEDAIRPSERGLDQWLHGALRQYHSWINCGAAIADGRMAGACGPESPLAYTTPALANALQSLFWSVFLSSWHMVDNAVRDRLVQYVAVATFNAMAIAGGSRGAHGGWDGLLRGGCGERLCLCKIMSHVTRRHGDGGEGEDPEDGAPGPLLTPSSWHRPSCIQPSQWLAICHVATLVHMLPYDVASAEDVGLIQACVEELHRLEQMDGNAGPGADMYVSRDKTVLSDLVAEFEAWSIRHRNAEPHAFSPALQADENANEAEMGLIMWGRLSVRMRREPCPRRVMHIDHIGPQLGAATLGGRDLIRDVVFM